MFEFCLLHRYLYDTRLTGGREQDREMVKRMHSLMDRKKEIWVQTYFVQRTRFFSSTSQAGFLRSEIAGLGIFLGDGLG